MLRMELNPGDLVEIVAIPSWVDRLGAAEQKVYRICLGFKLVIENIDDDGRCVFELHQEWSHFPEVSPFSLTFDAACVRRIEPFSDAEWAAISGWAESDVEIHGEVIAIDGRLKARLEGGVVSDMALPDGASTSDYLGRTIPVRIIKVHRKKRDLVVFPFSS